MQIGERTWIDDIKETCVKLSKRFLSFELWCHQAPLVLLWQLKWDIKDNLLAIIPFCAFCLSDGILIEIWGRAVFLFSAASSHTTHSLLERKVHRLAWFLAQRWGGTEWKLSHVTWVPLPACHSSSYRRAGTIDGSSGGKTAESWSLWNKWLPGWGEGVIEGSSLRTRAPEGCF